MFKIHMFRNELRLCDDYFENLSFIYMLAHEFPL